MIKQKSFFFLDFFHEKWPKWGPKGSKMRFKLSFEIVHEPCSIRNVIRSIIWSFLEHQNGAPGAPKWSSGDPFWSSFLIKNGDDANLDIRYHFGCFLGKDINGCRFYFWDGIQNLEFLAFYIRPFLSSVCAFIFQAKQHITNPNVECLRIPDSKSKLGMLKNSEFGILSIVYLAPPLSSVCASIFHVRWHVKHPNSECLTIPNSEFLA